MTQEKKITATADELAEYLFERKDKLPTVDFQADIDDWNFCIAVIDFVDSLMVIGNYYGGGCPMCYDLKDDTDSADLAEAISGWFHEIGCGEQVYL